MHWILADDRLLRIRNVFRRDRLFVTAVVDLHDAFARNGVYQPWLATGVFEHLVNHPFDENLTCRLGVLRVETCDVIPAEVGDRQVFGEGVVDKVFEYTRGQPWLVNALARECVMKIHDCRYDEPVTIEDVANAKETIIRARGTHVDSLMERLKEPRVRRVVEPVILGKERGAPTNDDDYRYVLDLGILRENEKHVLVPGNPMYAEIILRYLSNDEQVHFYSKYEKPFWLKPDGSLDMPALMAEFQRFWRENSGADREVYGYNEATPHLVMMGYLQRVVNGGGRIAREMALGSKRLDLCVEFGNFRYAVELKMRRNFSPTESPAQLAGYLDHLGLPEGWMAIFDDDASKSWDEKLYTRDEIVDGKTIHIIGL